MGERHNSEISCRLPHIGSTLSESVAVDIEETTTLRDTRPIYAALLSCLDVRESDHETVYALILLYNIAQLAPAQLLSVATDTDCYERLLLKCLQLETIATDTCCTASCVCSHMQQIKIAPCVLSP